MHGATSIKWGGAHAKGKMDRRNVGVHPLLGCVRSVQTSNLDNKAFLKFPYIFQVLKTLRDVIVGF